MVKNRIFATIPNKYPRYSVFKAIKYTRNTWVVYPISPLCLKTPKPKHFRYPKAILTVGDELRKERMDREITQHKVAEMIGVNRNFIYEMELGHHTNTIYALHKVFLFLGYIPKTLKIDETTLRGKLFAHRIRNGFTYTALAKKIRLDKSTLSRFEKGRACEQDTFIKICKHLDK